MRNEQFLLPLFRSRSQGEILARLFLFAADGESLSDLARHLGFDRATVQREVERLEQAGLLVTERVGRSRVVRPNRDAVIYRELDALLRKALGPKRLLEQALRGVVGVREAYIFGSWARRYEGEPGPLPRDVDLLVVGDADPDAVYAAVRSVEQQLGVEVDPVVVGTDEWEHEPAGLTRRVQAGSLVRLEVAT